MRNRNSDRPARLNDPAAGGLERVAFSRIVVDDKPLSSDEQRVLDSVMARCAEVCPDASCKPLVVRALPEGAFRLLGDRSQYDEFLAYIEDTHDRSRETRISAFVLPAEGGEGR